MFYMAWLSDRAFKIMRAEVLKCAGNDVAGQVQRDIALKRLDKMRSQLGDPASLEELRGAVSDMFPNFSEKSLKSAVAANQQDNGWGCIPFVGFLLAGTAGLIWVANLPYPMIRWPVAKSMPIILLPSFISMDRDYRQAISLVEQSDQLVNRATGPADIELGAEKIKDAQKHLDGLPVWFLGYYPEKYCTLFGCSWKFTVDEFENARKEIGRMEAKVFQEKNAQNQLSEVEKALSAAKLQYQQAKPGADQQQAIATWQTAIDQMKLIADKTLAKQMVQARLVAAERDFEVVVGDTDSRESTNTSIEAAKKYAKIAAESSQNPPHTADEWEQIASSWEEAIKLLKQVPKQDAGYLDAITKLAEYQKNLGIAQTRQKAERESVEALIAAKDMVPEWQKMAADSEPKRGELNSKIQDIINKLETVKYGTTAYLEAQSLLKFARETQQKIQL